MGEATSQDLWPSVEYCHWTCSLLREKIPHQSLVNLRLAEAIGQNSPIDAVEGSAPGGTEVGGEGWRIRLEGQWENVSQS